MQHALLNRPYKVFPPQLPLPTSHYQCGGNQQTIDYVFIRFPELLMTRLGQKALRSSILVLSGLQALLQA